MKIFRVSVEVPQLLTQKLHPTPPARHPPPTLHNSSSQEFRHTEFRSPISSNSLPCFKPCWAEGSSLTLSCRMQGFLRRVRPQLYLRHKQRWASPRRRQSLRPSSTFRPRLGFRQSIMKCTWEDFLTFLKKTKYISFWFLFLLSDQAPFIIRMPSSVVLRNKWVMIVLFYWSITPISPPTPPTPSPETPGGPLDAPGNLLDTPRPPLENYSLFRRRMLAQERRKATFYQF